jgi:2-C-methyl-D-erythritol 4-phosphate cytidylyltransferase
VAGGTGSRLQSDMPKQFVKLEGKEIIIHAIEKFLHYNSSIHIVISVHEDYLQATDAIIKKHNISAQLVKGGNTRYHSVKNALNAIDDNVAVVGIHDAARPFVSQETIKTCYELAAHLGNAVPSVSIHESLREVDGQFNKAVDRNKYRIVQTPQCFLLGEIKKAFALPYNESFTDDASVLEANGGKINLVEGNPENIKITLPKDLLIAATFLKND